MVALARGDWTDFKKSRRNESSESGKSRNRRHGKSGKAGRKAQVSIEFFFVAAFAVALAAVLLSSAEEQIRNVKSLDRAALSRAALDSVASAVNYASLAGNNSKILREVFVPSDATCFAWNSSKNALFCNVPEGNMHSGTVYAAPSVASACFSQGWLKVEVFNNGTAMTISCSSI